MIKQKLPGWNDSNKGGWQRRAELKKEVETAIGWYIRKAVSGGTLKRTVKPIWINFTWFEKTRRRDKDNVASAKKFILDALKENRIIVDDGNRFIQGFSDTFVYGADWAVNVEIKEI
ncbi:MAG: hypothetical protein LUD19_01255 [Clostridia bacterium]|nr:hypothetical protein [Clostridia bacterium]